MKGLAPLQLLNSTRPEPAVRSNWIRTVRVEGDRRQPNRSRPVGYAGVSTADQNFALPEVADRSRMRKRSSLSTAGASSSSGDWTLRVLIVRNTHAHRRHATVVRSVSAHDRSEIFVADIAQRSCSQ